MTHAFVLDSRFCTGCKACQAACKDKNQLPAGVLWRRVYEISGGGWRIKGDAWVSDVYAYSLSMACNHCEYPKCAGVCPTRAYSVRPDGIVLLDTQRCIGCGYCAWACPYGAPQYDRESGVMTKCDFCLDELQMDRTPACVAACPLRVLDAVDTDDFQIRPELLQAVPPMPDPVSRNPRFLIQPHAAAARAGSIAAVIANKEEVPSIK